MPTGHYERKTRDPLDRFIEKVDISESACWEWAGWTNGAGYGKFYAGKDAPKEYAYRWLYERLIEPIPAEMTIDHLCRNPICVNPDHLEVVTQAVNIARGTALARAIEYQTSKTHCPDGHEFTLDNTYRWHGDGARMCKACARDRMRARRAELKKRDE